MNCRYQLNSAPKRRFAIALCSTATCLALTVAALARVGVSSALAKGPAFKRLYAFTGAADGSNPYAGLVADETGNLYGTTYNGGTRDAGTVFRLAPDGTLTTLHTFSNNGIDGAGPDAGLILDKAGNLYGTTNAGGPHNVGTVFKIAPDGSESVLYAFTGGSDGAFPDAGLLERRGDLYGMTTIGGAFGYGIVFKVAPDGTEKVLHSFQSGKDGAEPACTALIADKTGNLYGTTELGGTTDLGTVFKLAAGHREAVLYTFKGGNDGSYPIAALIVDKAGNLYGTTNAGGTHNLGTVFTLAPDGTETVLYSFKGGKDGAYPWASVVEDEAGNLYGSTAWGGGNDDGTTFKLAPDGTETVLHSLNGQSDGSEPIGGLIADDPAQKGALFGTTSGGGADNVGTIFSIEK